VSEKNWRIETVIWSKELPKSEGWYWFKTDSSSPPEMTRLRSAILLVTQDPLYIHRPLRVAFPVGSYECDEMGGFWAGPIEEPQT
jgi:hypothetical protein